MNLKFFEKKKTSTQDLIWETRRIWQGDIKNGDIYSGQKLQKNIHQANVHQRWDSRLEEKMMHRMTEERWELLTGTSNARYGWKEDSK